MEKLILRVIVRYNKWIKFVAFATMTVTFAIDVLYSGQPIAGKLYSYFNVLFLCFMAWFTIYQTLLITEKRKYISYGILNIGITFFFIASFTLSLILLMVFIMNFGETESINFMFVSVTIMLTVLKFQCARKM